MKTRPCGSGFVTAIPTWEDPEVVMWGQNKEESTYLAAKHHVDLSHKVANAEAKLAQEFAAQAHAEYMKIRARA